MNTYKKYKAESIKGETLARKIEYMLTDIQEKHWEKFLKEAINDYWKAIRDIETRD